MSSRCACASLPRLFPNWRICAFSAALAVPAWELAACEDEFGVCWTAPSRVMENKVMRTGLNDIAASGKTAVLSIWYLAARSQLPSNTEHLILGRKFAAAAR